VIDIQITRGIAIVSTKPYSPRAVEVIRGVRGRRWDPRTKAWIVPLHTLQQSVEKLVRTGELVEVNGRAWAGAPDTQQMMQAQQVAEIEAEKAANPFTPLFAALPPRLRQPTYDALWQVLAPGAGGDAGLLVLLDQAHSAHEHDGGHVLRGRAS
jgi:hypothetical protein